MPLRYRFLCWIFLLISPLLWGYTFDQPDYTLQRFLEENSGEQPLLDQLSVRVNSPPDPINSIQTKALLVGVVFTGTDSDIETRAWLIAFKKRMQALRIDYRLDVYYMSDTLNVERVAEIFETVRYSDFDYLIVDGVNGYSRPLLERLLKKDTPRIIVSNVSAPVDAWRFHPPLIYVGMDHTQSMNRLASYLSHRLDTDAMIDVISVEDSYLAERRCRVFVNQLEDMGRSIKEFYVVKDYQQAAKRAAMHLLEQRYPDNQRNRELVEHFIFSCTPSISAGVLEALQNKKLERVYTNSWSGQRRYSQAIHQYLLVTVLGMHDNMAIAAAEVIKANIESRLLPMVYVQQSQLFTQDMDQQTLNIMYEQVFRYSRSLWPH